ncbi:hypothetical protein [Vibrio sonorensis]|uniref:hypothetical protein n=1 Tax=Vibrio sonorensis TaxID=1004316 RepID=UPI00158648E0|nr:hypothetical protein [Vibrio sonorensis]
MELRNNKGEVTHVADNLTLKEIEDLGFTIDLVDEKFDPNEHWQSGMERDEDPLSNFKF